MLLSPRQARSDGGALNKIFVFSNDIHVLGKHRFGCLLNRRRQCFRTLGANSNTTHAHNANIRIGVRWIPRINRLDRTLSDTKATVDTLSD